MSAIGIFLFLVAPSLLVPIVTVAFVRKSRYHRDFTWVCGLTAVAAVIWMVIAVWDGQTALNGFPADWPAEFSEEEWQHPFVRWMLFAVPSVPTFAAVVAYWLYGRPRATFE